MVWTLANFGCVGPRSFFLNLIRFWPWSLKSLLSRSLDAPKTVDWGFTPVNWGAHSAPPVLASFLAEKANEGKQEEGGGKGRKKNLEPHFSFLGP